MFEAERVYGLIVIVSLVGHQPQGDRPSPVQSQSVVQSALSSESCRGSKTVRAEPPKDPNADAFGFGDWYTNLDRTIWVRKSLWGAGQQGNKVIWIRPAGSLITVTGRRLDAEGPALHISADRGYPTGFT